MKIEENLSSLSIFLFLNLEKTYKNKASFFFFFLKKRDYEFIQENGLHHIVVALIETHINKLNSDKSANDEPCIDKLNKT